ncbi:MAG: hypothetical protein HY698_13610 [Deltaproteobacteria bacterium]|nr:hypothetical protein [Deltaproteobacteria bacterium]
MRRKIVQGVAVLVAVLVAALAAASARVAQAATYEVGPGRPHADLSTVATLLQPGDLVLLQGGTTYPGGVVFRRAGSAAQPIIVRGVRNDGARPILSGGTNTIEVYADHYVLEGLELTGGTSRCFYHHGHDITLLDSVVHDCPAHGILGADTESGSLTLDHVEVYRCGSGDRRHQIYMATDESTHPGAVFRMQFCYVHDGNGGNNVKSRAERNEIYYNWIEGAFCHELELIGPDGQDPGLAREDSDVVGNVIYSRGTFYSTRVGGDGTGETNGRYRFVNNTFLLGPQARSVFRIFDGIESLEAHNNVMVRLGGGGVSVTRTAEASWSSGREVIAGSHNWLPAGSTDIPPGLASTASGNDPLFVDAQAPDPRPAVQSPLVDGALAETASPEGFPFPRPLGRPLFHPPLRRIEVGAVNRPQVGAPDIGAFEYGQAEPVPDGGVVDAAATADAAVTADAAAPNDAPSGNLDAGLAGDGKASPDGSTATDQEVSGACGCRVGGQGEPRGSVAVLVYLSFVSLLARRWRSTRVLRGSNEPKAAPAR